MVDYFHVLTAAHCFRMSESLMNQGNHHKTVFYNDVNLNDYGWFVGDAKDKYEKE